MKTTALPAEERDSRVGTVFALVAGLCDGLTGAALVATPSLVLRALGLPPPTGEGLVFLRFAGIFVAGIGAAYLLPFLVSDRAVREQRLRFAIELTALVRLAVALFLASEVMLGSLAASWLIVGAFDGAVAVIQLAMRDRGVFGEGP